MTITMHPPGRLERFLRAGGYLATALIGVSVLVDPPILNSVLGQVLTALWAMFILTAAPAIAAAWLARYRLEYVLLPVFGSALVVSVVAIWFRYGQGESDYTLPRVLTATALICVFAARFVSLHRIVKMGAARWTRNSSSGSPE